MMVERRLLLTIKSIIRAGADIYKIRSNGHPLIDSCTRQHVRDDIECFAKKEKEKSGKPVVEIERNVVEIENCMFKIYFCFRFAEFVLIEMLNAHCHVVTHFVWNVLENYLSVHFVEAPTPQLPEYSSTKLLILRISFNDY